MAKTRRERAPARSTVDLGATGAAAVDDRRARLDALYPVRFPDELAAIWALAERLAPASPREAFTALGVHLCGPFDLLAGRLGDRPPPLPLLLHWRFANDPPELFNVAVDDEEGIRWGYYFDDPQRRAPIVCHYYCGEPFALTIDGATLIEALRAHLERRVAALDAAIAEDPADSAAQRRELAGLGALRRALTEVGTGEREQEGAAYLAAHVLRGRRRRRPIAATSDGMGVLAPARRYRDPGLSPARLAEETRASDPRLLTSLAEAALADGFPATALQIGRELWARGRGETLRRPAARLLAAAYRDLRRPGLALTVETHADHCDLASVDVLAQPPGGGPRRVARAAGRDPAWRIAALRRIQPATIHLEEATSAELEGLFAATWPTVRRLTLTLAADAGYRSAFDRLLDGAAMPGLLHLTLPGAAYPVDLLPALAASPVLKDLSSLSFAASALTAAERDAFVEAWEAGDELQLFADTAGCVDNAAVYNLGILARDLGDYGRALDLFERSLALGGDHWDYTEKGIALLELGELGPAIHCFEMAVRRSRSYLVAWLNLAEAHRRAGEFTDALATLDRASAVARGKRSRLALLGLRARVLVSAGDEAAAAALAGELAARAGDLLRRRPTADLNYWRAAGHLLAGARGDALAELHAAIERDPRHLEEALDDDLFAPLHGDLEEFAFGA